MSAPVTDPVADPTAAGVPADLLDERLIQEQGLVGAVLAFVRRVRSGELGSLPVVVGLVIIAVVFQTQAQTFLSSRNLVSIAQFAAPVGIIALGIVLVLLLGEIDLSVGSMSGLSASIMAVLVTYHAQSLWIAIAAAIGAGVAVGLVYGLLYTKVGVPSFVISLAGLLALLGLQLRTLGENGSVNLPPTSGLIVFARQKFVTGGAAYGLMALAVLLYVGARLLTWRRRRAAGLSTEPLTLLAVKAVALLAGLLYAAYYLGIDRGIPYLTILFVVLVVLVDLALRRTRWGRHVFAVGGNEEAARRAGIKVDRVYISVFVSCSVLAALGGLLAAGQLTSVSQSSGGTDTNLTAISAAVIGGTSLFGGRGSAWSALLGIFVLTSIQFGLNLIGVDASVRYVVTGLVLLLAVAIDSVSRRARSSSGRG
ncbi:sugar ABC transporter permease [Nocardioides sp. TRM66260-LWL]|uniref:sugar ABC transporter permease n=1 Tax=Nocardioides sp. TRM66260-LWL TaxID=2874478 RepID=UPI001CC5935C|nr:sugar ABC transporter permease [Nocardioides sp. TRM66260-LWL]MBZ5735154.1 sugar ABC transporter permease [Nocardioides sp. TRM66260-LWL]